MAGAFSSVFDVRAASLSHRVAMLVKIASTKSIRMFSYHVEQPGNGGFHPYPLNKTCMHT